jgi:riboflavin biosynthesis pyrimidine reductase
MSSVIQVYPPGGDSHPVDGLYLQHDLREERRGARPFVYTNFVSSLDGRIAVKQEDRNRWRIPPQIQTDEDRRLYHELAAQADVIIITGRHARSILQNEQLLPFPYLTPVERCDLKQWRLDHGRGAVPALAVVSMTLKFPGGEIRNTLGCDVHALTGSEGKDTQKRTLTEQGVEVMVPGEQPFVPGAALVEALGQRGLALQYSVAGPGVLNTLLDDGVLDRLYLTRVDTLVAGKEYYSFCEAEHLQRVLVPRLRVQYRLEDTARVGQSFEVYDIRY